MQIRDKVLSRPAMAEKSGLHVNTIKGYEKEGRLADIDYLALLALETGHCLSDLLNKRLLAGRYCKAVKEQGLVVQSLETNEQSVIPFHSATIRVHGSDQCRIIDTKLIPAGIDADKLLVLDSLQGAESTGKAYVYDTTDRMIQDGQMFVLDIGNGPIVRRIQYGLSGSIVMTIENSTIPPLVIPREQIDHITILGKVVCVISFL